MDFFRDKFGQRTRYGLAGAILVLSYFYLFLFRAPTSFPKNVIISIDNGKSLAEISVELKKERVIRSPFWFTNFVIIQKHERAIVGGQYSFDRSLNVYQIAKRLASGQFNTNQIKTTIPEGSNSNDISLILKKNYPNFDVEKFLTLARVKEGYLFPDTYYFGAAVQPAQAVGVMTATFYRKIQQTEISEAIKKFNRPIGEVVIMASILEGEARFMKTRQTIAGILWERLRLGMPFQVDVSFRYINGKTTNDLTLADLKLDSPYNTYIHKGLPPTPISNPGLDSIMAAVTPIKTNYVYFLSDSSGTMHYARTLDEHLANKKKYLP